MEIRQVNNLDNEIYHNSEEYKDYWSSSNIKKYLDTPREAHYQKFFAPHKETDALAFGSALHDFLESKHITGKDFPYNIFEPPINPKTGKSYGKETKAYQLELSKIENPISADDMQTIDEIWSMIRNSSYSWYFEQTILKKGIAEPSFFVEGLHKYKYRADVLTDKTIFDYKTVAKRYWRAELLNRQIVNLEYDISAAMYQYFEHKRTGVWKPFYIVWLMKEPPFDILIQDISPFCFEVFGNNEPIVNSGAMTFLKLKDQHELCEMSGCWPGLSNQFDKFRGLRLAETAPRFERGFNEFEID
jgi:hypothetical protein